MLLENIELPNNLPFTLSISNVAEEDFHFHNEMEMLLILKGKAKCKIHNVLYTLEKGDVLIIDTKDMHRIYDSSPDILMLDMYIDLKYYEDLYPNIDYMIFACEDYSKTSSLKYQDLQKKVSVLKHHIAKTGLSYFHDKDNTPLLIDCIDDLIFTLVNQFQGFLIEDYKFKADTGDPGDVDLKRLYKIIKYIYQNYDKKITLEDLSDIVYLNPYYISHLIKNTSGLSFQNFLNYIRLEYAEKLLVENKLTLTQISESCGFSSLSYFNKCFKTWYKTTPAQFRKQLNPCERRFHDPFSEDETIRLLKTYILASHSKRNRDLFSKYSHHIFIPVKQTFKAGRPYNKAFPLRIHISTDEDIFMLNYQREKVKELHPAAILLDYMKLSEKKSKPEVVNILHSLNTLGLPLQIYLNETFNDSQIEGIVKSMDIPFVTSKIADLRRDPNKTAGESSTVCSALRSIITDPVRTINLSGISDALFTPLGLLTPLYYIYSLLAQIDGNITEQREQYMIIKDEYSIYVLIFQEDRESKLKAHIHIGEIYGQHLLVEKIYTKDHSCYKIMDTLNKPIMLSDNVKSKINDFSSGIINLSQIDVSGSLDLNFDMDPDSFMLIEIIDQSGII